MCNYQGYEFGAGTYPDSVCIDGSLHDADHCDDNGHIYLNDEDVPCPMCRPSEAVKWWAERNAMFWEDGEDENDESGHNERARSTALNLVTEIRANRGVTEPFETAPESEAS